MTRRRWMADEVSGNRAFLVGAHADHLSRVLRAQIGQEFEITTGETVHVGRIVSITAERVEFELGAQIPAPKSVPVTLVLSIFKFDRMEWAIEKCTELGVARIVPTVAQRTEVHLAAAAVKRAERWRRIAQQATEQSRRTSVPDILPPMKLKDAVALAGSLRILLSERETEVTLKSVLQARSGSSEVVMALGPEGGWTDEEMNLFEREDWTAVSLGGTILRAETAAIASLAVVLTELRT